MPDLPDRTVLCTLHDRLLHGDRLAPEELFRSLAGPLQEEIRRRFPNVNEHLVVDGVIDAILDHCTLPGKFNPEKAVSLDRFLAKAAVRNVQNSLRGERRRKQREWEVGRKNREADVALEPVAGNIQQEEQGRLEATQAAMLDALPDPGDKAILLLKFQGVRDTAAYARVLGITELPEEQQREQVKRHKDRIRVFLRRKGLLP